MLPLNILQYLIILIVTIQLYINTKTVAQTSFVKYYHDYTKDAVRYKRTYFFRKLEKIYTGIYYYRYHHKI